MSDEVWTDPRNERERRLAELNKRYAWVGSELVRAHREGKIDSEAVRFFIVAQQPFLRDENGEPVIRDGEPMIDYEAEPFYFGRAQAYSYVGHACGPRLERTVAGQMDVSLQLLERASPSVVLGLLCEDLNALHARELEREKLREAG